MIPESFKQDLLNRVDMVELVSRYVQLKKAGANYLGLCPFHSEKSPSFTVSPAKQFYHCFGCGAHGNAIGFLMSYSSLGYVDAVKDLASSLGMQVPEAVPRSPAEAARRERETDLYALMETAMDHYRAELRKSPRAIDYLKGRGLSGEIAARYRIGYATDDWQGLRAAFGYYEEPGLVECGVVIANEGKRYDRFRDRIIFPITNARGAVIGFGGRVIGEGEPKYLNSPETPLFEKGREVYGLVQAREGIQRARKVLIVEGYMDVVALAQHGIGYAVATLGTATTPVHVSKLLRLADEIVFCFDGDAAGRKAAWRALEVSLPLAVDNKPIRFLFLPKEHDPDSCVRAEGSEAFEQRVRGAVPLSGFLVSELRAATDLASAEGRSQFMVAARGHLQKLTAPALKMQITKEVAELAQLTREEAEQILGTAAEPRAYARPAPPRQQFAAPSTLEWKLLTCVAAHPVLARGLELGVLDPALPETQVLAELAHWIAGLGAADTAMSALLIENFQGRAEAELLFNAQAAATDARLADEDLARQFDQIQARLRLARRREALQDMQKRLAAGRLSRDEFAEYGRELAEVKNMELSLRSES